MSNGIQSSEVMRVLRDQLEHIGTTVDLNAPVYLVERVDPSILGGIILEQRGKRYDASVRAQLSNIRKQLADTFIGVEDDE